MSGDPLEAGRELEGADPQRDVDAPRRRFVLDETGFEEVPVKYRRFYRRWKGSGDSLGANEVICPVCKVVIRSTREIREGDRLYCMPCMSRILVVRGASGMLEAQVAY
jgi:hypothetical protein